MSRRTVIIVFCWLAAFGGALALDRPIADYNRTHGLEKPQNKRGEKSSPADLPRPSWTAGTYRIAEVVKFPGVYWTTVILAIGVLVLHREHGRAAAVVALTGLLATANHLIKWSVGRHRPITGADPFDVNPLVGGLQGLFGAEANLSFPSGHASLAFANAAALALLLPRWRWVFYVIATATAVERVLENAHFASDCVAGAALGIGCAHLAYWAVRRVARKTDTPVAIQPASN
jgi:membrane-associated phospholipid phosphatase